MKKILGIVVLSLLLCGNAFADTSARELFKKCKFAIKMLDEGNNNSLTMLEKVKGHNCMTIISTMIETAASQNVIDKALGKKVPTNLLNSCPPNEGEMAYGQYMRVFVKYLIDHPEDMHLDYTYVFGRSLHYHFPCKN